MGNVNKQCKKGLRLLLFCSFLYAGASLLSLNVFADNFEYSPVRQKYAIAPASLYGNGYFYGQYVKTEAVWAFNSITYMTDNALNYGTEKVDYTGSFAKDLTTFDPV